MGRLHGRSKSRTTPMLSIKIHAITHYITHRYIIYEFPGLISRTSQHKHAPLT